MSGRRDTDMKWEPPRCQHGFILLGCPVLPCPEQSEYLAQQRAALDRWEESQRQAAQEIVQSLTQPPMTVELDSVDTPPLVSKSMGYGTNTGNLVECRGCGGLTFDTEADQCSFCPEGSMASGRFVQVMAWLTVIVVLALVAQIFGWLPT